MKTEPYKLASFQGTMITMIMDADAHAVVAMRNRVSFIDAQVWSREALEADYQPAELSPESQQLVLQQFVGYGRSVGLTPAAGVYLKKLGLMQGQDLLDAVRKGMATLAVIKKEAARMEQEDKTKDVTPKGAPRKLTGAAAAAVKRKEERLAAEAKQLAGDVTADQTKLEEAGAPDARLPVTPKGGRKKADPAKQTAKKEPADKKDTGPKVTKNTPSADHAKKILKGTARKDAQVSAAGDFDATKLKGADGEYKSASSMFKGLLFEGKLSDDAIAKAVDKKFSLGEQKAKDYVKWNRGWFRRQGVKIADAK